MFYVYVYMWNLHVRIGFFLIFILFVRCKMKFEKEYGPEHILKWIMQLIVYMNVIMGELWSKLCAGCVIDNLGSPDIGEILPKFR